MGLIVEDMPIFSFDYKKKDTVKTLYHGSTAIIKKPLFGVGKSDNDYGSGFYTTEIPERAEEWAYLMGGDSSVVNVYEIETKELKVIDLDDFGPLAWMAEVGFNRNIAGVEHGEYFEEFMRKYRVNTDDVDIIIGYRADDKYTEVVKFFFNDLITIEEAKKLFYKGELGKQVFIKSEKAFNLLEFKKYYNVHDAVTNAEFKARQEVAQFLNRRMATITRETPQGLRYLDAVVDNYVYNNEYDYYTLS